MKNECDVIDPLVTTIRSFARPSFTKFYTYRPCKFIYQVAKMSGSTDTRMFLLQSLSASIQLCITAWSHIVHVLLGLVRPSCEAYTGVWSQGSADVCVIKARLKMYCLSSAWCYCYISSVDVLELHMGRNHLPARATRIHEYSKTNQRMNWIYLNKIRPNRCSL